MKYTSNKQDIKSGAAIVNTISSLKNWCTKGITRVKHLLGPDNNFFSLNDFCCKYEILTYLLSYLLTPSQLLRINIGCKVSSDRF